jgi:hypothetical protein
MWLVVCLIYVRNKPNKYLYIILTVDYLLMSSQIIGKAGSCVQRSAIQVRYRSRDFCLSVFMIGKN